MDQLQDAVRRVDFGYFIRPVSETGTGAARVEPVLGYLVACGDRFGLFDTGIGAGHDDLDAHYHPCRRPLGEALAVHGVGIGDVAWVANSHLHFDHCGGNPLLADRPIFVQTTELATARGRDDYTLPELVTTGTRYETVTGQAEIAPNVYLVPTPGHVEGHQSLVVRLADGTVICAGQSHDTASLFSSDVLSRGAIGDGTAEPVPPPPAWLEALLSWDPARVVFAHDLAVWVPA
ncbi:MAG TPA: MBL fold metallo-hydrolase [Acidimicrobiales bacterium]|jgi:glyoxylase-like metal-dependent hydrolase (beta-lactamase superfamily II)